MKKLAFILGLAVLLLGSCVCAGTGTVWIYNKLTAPQQITALYIYPTGSPNTNSIITAPLSTDEGTVEYGVEPGDTTVHAIIDYGAKTATDTLFVTAGSVYPAFSISDADID